MDGRTDGRVSCVLSCLSNVSASCPEMFKALEKDGKIELDLQQVCTRTEDAASHLLC